MTLQQLIEQIAQNPYPVWAYFGLIPTTAALSAITAQGEGAIPPWKYLYATLIYLSCVPGIFAIAFDISLFLFERHSILQTDIYTQVLPIASMFLTLFIIRRNVNLDDIPGFDKLSGLVTMIAGTISFLWFLDKLHIIAFISMNIYQLIAIFALFLLLIRWGWSKLF